MSVLSKHRNAHLIRYYFHQSGMRHRVLELKPSYFREGSISGTEDLIGEVEDMELNQAIDTGEIPLALVHQKPYTRKYETDTYTVYDV